jgi:hypothetical protein
MGRYRHRDSVGCFHRRQIQGKSAGPFSAVLVFPNSSKPAVCARSLWNRQGFGLEITGKCDLFLGHNEDYDVGHKRL